MGQIDVTDAWLYKYMSIVDEAIINMLIRFMSILLINIQNSVVFFERRLLTG